MRVICWDLYIPSHLVANTRISLQTQKFRGKLRAAAIHHSSSGAPWLPPILSCLPRPVDCCAVPFLAKKNANWVLYESNRDCKGTASSVVAHGYQAPRISFRQHTLKGDGASILTFNMISISFYWSFMWVATHRHSASASTCGTAFISLKLKPLQVLPVGQNTPVPPLEGTSEASNGRPYTKESSYILYCVFGVNW